MGKRLEAHAPPCVPFICHYHDFFYVVCVLFLLLHRTEPVKPKIFPASEETELHRRLSVNITIGEKLTVLDKSNVTIECLAEGIPPPSLSWSNDGKKVENSGRNFLHLRSVSKEDSGRYTCSADNFLGSDRQSAILTVRGKKTK